MTRRRRWLLCLCGCITLGASGVGRASDPRLPPLEQAPLAELTSAQLRTAIQKTIPSIQAAAAGSAKERTCFTCHHQAMPMLALSEIRDANLAIDEALLQSQAEHTRRHLQRGYRNYLKGKGQGGRVTTAGYLLWALEAVQENSNEQTAAAASYLMGEEREGHWRQSSARPPTSGSDFTNTYLAVRAIETYADEDTRQRWQARSSAVAQWLVKAKAQDQEDRVFRLRLAEYLEVEPETKAAFLRELVQQQRYDGGWSQKQNMQSDAYATATALVALLAIHEPDESTASAIRRGLAWLLQHQHADGTWHVRTRAKGFQTYFETGFPYGKDQFISMSASCWAVLALTRAL